MNGSKPCEARDGDGFTRNQIALAQKKGPTHDPR